MNMDARKTRANDRGIQRKAVSLLLLAGWLAASSVIVFAQLDRESRYRPELADYVPPAFRSFSQAVIVKRLLNDRDDTRRTYVEAARLLLRRPVPAENLSLYGLSAARAGKDDLSFQAIGLAAARGWHDEVSQYAALDAASQAGDWPSASIRLQALMQVQSQPPMLGRAVQGFMMDAHGRAALAVLIVKNPAFQYRLLSFAGAYGVNGSFPLLVNALKPFRGRIDCGSLRTLVARWLAQGDAGLALDAWTGLCARGEANRGKDLAFSTPYGDTDPFAWHIPDQPAISWSIDPRSGSLSYSKDENFGRLLAWRMLTLAPGPHRLKLEGRPVLKNGNYPLLRLRCMPSGDSVKMSSSPDDHSMLTTQIPQCCRVQKLEVKVLRGSFLGFRLADL